MTFALSGIIRMNMYIYCASLHSDFMEGLYNLTIGAIGNEIWDNYFMIAVI